MFYFTEKPHMFFHSNMIFMSVTTVLIIYLAFHPLLRNQGHYVKPEIWTHLNPMKFNKSKCKVLLLGGDNPENRYRLGDE